MIVEIDGGVFVLFASDFSSAIPVLRMLIRNVSSWPEVTKAEIFPQETNPVVWSCRAFYTAGSIIIVIPDEDMGPGSPPVPDAELTNLFGVAVIKLSLVKYVCLIRGAKAMATHSFLT